MKVIGAGFGRTGTASLSHALEELGFGPCYHMMEALSHPEHISTWLAAYDGESVDWGELFASYTSTTDWPGCSFWEQLIEHYPEAKVILSTRDSGAWYDSVQRTFVQARDSAAGPDGMPAEIMELFRHIGEGTFSGKMDDREHAIEVFERHNERVAAAVPDDRLLVYQVGDGWEPLCEFLGVEVPDAPFPRLNDKGSFKEFITEQIRERSRADQDT